MSAGRVCFYRSFNTAVFCALPCFVLCRVLCFAVFCVLPEAARASAGGGRRRVAARGALTFAFPHPV